MIKNFLSVCFLFLSFHIFSQDVDTMKSVARFSSDTELTSYINKAKSSGLSLIEVEELINAQGATSDELSKLRALWNTGAIITGSCYKKLWNFIYVFIFKKTTSKSSTFFWSNFSIT